MANERRKRELDRQIAELEGQLGMMGDESLEGEMGWMDYAVHGDRSGLENLANRALQKRQQAEATAEAKNRAMKALEDADADFVGLGAASSPVDSAKAAAMMRYAVSEGKRVGLDDEYLKPFIARLAPQEKKVTENVTPKESEETPKKRDLIAVLSDSRRLSKMDNPDTKELETVLSELKGFEPDSSSRDLIDDAIAGLENKKVAAAKADSTNVIANAMRIVDTKDKASNKLKNLKEERKNVEALPDSPEKQQALAKIDNAIKANSPKATDKDMVSAANSITYNNLISNEANGKVNATGGGKNYEFEIKPLPNGKYNLMYKGKTVRANIGRK